MSWLTYRGLENCAGSPGWCGYQQVEAFWLLLPSQTLAVSAGRFHTVFPLVTTTAKAQPSVQWVRFGTVPGMLVGNGMARGIPMSLRICGKTNGIRMLG